MPKSMSCVHIATARSRGHLPFNSSSFPFLLNSRRRLKSSKTIGGIRCNFGIASAKAARSISRDGDAFALFPSFASDSSSDLIIDDSARRPLNTSHAATKSTTLDVFVVPAIVSFVSFSSSFSSAASFECSDESGDGDDEATRRTRRRRFPTRRRSRRRDDDDGRRKSSVVVLCDDAKNAHRENKEPTTRVVILSRVCDESARAFKVTTKRANARAKARTFRLGYQYGGGGATTRNMSHMSRASTRRCALYYERRSGVQNWRRLRRRRVLDVYMGPG
jgi:hypothetical protein